MLKVVLSSQQFSAAVWICSYNRNLCVHSNPRWEQPYVGPQLPLQARGVRWREKGNKEERKNMGPQFSAEQREACSSWEVGFTHKHLLWVSQPLLRSCDSCGSHFLISQWISELIISVCWWNVWLSYRSSCDNPSLLASCQLTEQLSLNNLSLMLLQKNLYLYIRIKKNKKKHVFCKLERLPSYSLGAAYLHV